MTQNCCRLSSNVALAKSMVTSAVTMLREKSRETNIMPELGILRLKLQGSTKTVHIVVSNNTEREELFEIIYKMHKCWYLLSCVSRHNRPRHQFAGD